jgi:hypothetical protein
VAQAWEAARFFGDEDFVWVDPAVETAPTMPATVPALAPVRPRRRGGSRTLVGDLGRLRAGLAVQTAALPPRARLLLAASMLAGLLVLALVLTVGRGEQTAEETPRAGASPKKERPENATVARTLRKGDRTPAVADLQRALGALGLYSQAVDGVFGDSTGAAVLAFQRDHGLAADGIAGPTTIKVLVETLGTGAESDAAVAEDGLSAAVQAGRLSSASAERYRKTAADSLERLHALPPGRVPALALAFHSVATMAADYDEPRALTLFSMLNTTADYLADHAPPTQRIDIRDADGVVYRFFPEHGFQFHPIAEFARLNNLARNDRGEAVKRLADALIARAIRSGKTIVWEYYFPFGGPTHWSSGFAQAIAAQALARSSALLDDPKLGDAARAAYRGVSRGLWLEIAGGRWVREYGFSDMAILNAQLQSLVSLYDYVQMTGDSLARADVSKMASATRSVLAQFDTGCWSRYSLGGSPASLHYHTYHVQLLKQLAAKTGDPLWSTTAARWDGYLQTGGPTAC